MSRQVDRDSPIQMFVDALPIYDQNMIEASLAWELANPGKSWGYGIMGTNKGGNMEQENIAKDVIASVEHLNGFLEDAAKLGVVVDFKFRKELLTGAMNTIPKIVLEPEFKVALEISK